MPIALPSVQKIQGTDGLVVGPNASSITQFLGSNITITGDPISSTLLFSVPAPGVVTYFADAGSALPAPNLTLSGTAVQGLTTSGAGSTVTFTISDWTTTQKGVGLLATAAEATTGTSTSKVVTPEGLATKLGTQTTYALPYSTGATTAVGWIGPLTSGQLLIGSGTTPVAAILTAGTDIAIANSAGSITINSTASATSVKYYANDGTTAAAVGGNLYLLGSVLQGVITSGNNYDTIVFSMQDWTTALKGVGVLATTAEATTGTSTSKAVTPEGLAAKLGTQTTDALPYSTGATTAVGWIGPLTSGQLLIGSGTTPVAATLTAGPGISVANAAGAITITATSLASSLFVGDDGTTAAVVGGNLYLLGSLQQGLITSGNKFDTIVFSMQDWTTALKGVGVLATTAEATTGTSTSKVVTPQGLSTKLGTQTTYALPYSTGATTAVGWIGPLTSGQLLIGSGTTPAAATLTAGAGIIVTNAAGGITIHANNTLFTENDGTTAAAIGGNIYLLGSVQQGVITSGNGLDTIVFSMQDGLDDGAKRRGRSSDDGGSHHRHIDEQSRYAARPLYQTRHADNLCPALFHGRYNGRWLDRPPDERPAADRQRHHTGGGDADGGRGYYRDERRRSDHDQCQQHSLYRERRNHCGGHRRQYLSARLGAARRHHERQRTRYDCLLDAGPMQDWTTALKGVGVLATTAEATTGTSTSKVVTPQGLAAKLGTQTTYALPYSTGATTAVGWIGPLTSGQLLIGSGTTPVAATLTAGTGISVANAAGGITITNVGLVWTSTAVSVNPVVANTGYVCTATSPTVVTLTLNTMVQYSLLEVAQRGTGQWKIAVSATGKLIYLGNQVTTDTTGYLQSTADGDSVRLLCTTADTEWQVLSSVGNITWA
ncbi:MAG: hypothetical protein HW387_1728 [Parachlamydiales bacterium]|nr:hypothetical protein [Parachlamydiales bacterium]